jgi:hypothetical protein
MFINNFQVVIPPQPSYFSYDNMLLKINTVISLHCDSGLNTVHINHKAALSILPFINTFIKEQWKEEAWCLYHLTYWLLYTSPSSKDGGNTFFSKMLVNNL